MTLLGYVFKNQSSIFLQLLVKSFPIIIIIIVIIINILIIIHLNFFIFSFIIVGYVIVYYFINIDLFFFLFFYSFCILNSFLLHSPTFISSFDLFRFFNFVIPIRAPQESIGSLPPAFYHFKCSYPYWP